MSQRTYLTAYSCDSTSWLIYPAYGYAMKTHGLEIKERAHSEFYKDRKGKVKNLDLAKEYKHFERQITKLWKLRGVTWD